MGAFHGMVLTARDDFAASPGCAVRSGPALGGLALLLVPLEDDLDLERSDHQNEHQEKATFGHALSPDVKPAGRVPAGFVILRPCLLTGG